MPYVKHVPVTTRIKELRQRAGFSMPEMARIMGLKGASSYQRYEDPNLFKRKYLDYEKVDLLVTGLTGRGNPPITVIEVKTLGGPIGDATLHTFADSLTAEQRLIFLEILQGKQEDR